ncbi:MAG TPA: L,D-transpeptidase [Anaerolineales bacterium]|nr:L,D-transpeptidase [Anaerolineales bacterium]HLO30529.1 L,D-transpeptidase [Anaerolineales bacterium]
MTKISRRDFLKLGTSAIAGIWIYPFLPDFQTFDDSPQVRVATKAVTVHSGASDQNRITGQRFRDELVNIYEEVDAGAPDYNPIWYRVWGGYIHRARLQKVKVLFNKPLTSIPEGTRHVAEVTVPYTQAMRYTKIYGWQPNLRLYYGSVHWMTGIDEGPDGEPWYRIFDELVGFPYHVPAIHLRPIPLEEWSVITPDLPLEDKRIEVNLTTQTLIAYELDKELLKTKISSGIANSGTNTGLSTQTPTGEFRIISKYPSKHMGNGNLFASPEDYELPGVPWTCFFHEAGYAFHGTYWHDNFGTPMSRGCVNMRIEEAKWLFRWVRPLHEQDRVYSPGYGTSVVITP